jgi:hypothetical protein
MMAMVLGVALVVAIAGLAAMGIITNIPTVKADVTCNPSDNCSSPGQSEFSNVGQCKKSEESLNTEKDIARLSCKYHINPN